MHRFMPLLMATAAGAFTLIWTNSVAQTDAPRSASSEYRNAFAAVSGGHYFGEDEPEEVKRLTPGELKARLSYGSESFRRAQAEGQVAQLRNRLDRANALTTKQAQLMKRILIEARDRQERDLREQYAGHRVTAAGASWTGMITLASDELGISDHDQHLAQLEDFSRQQITAVTAVLTPQQLKVYRQIQRERVAQQRSFMGEGHPQSP
ncbi:MAG TPA: hypothetical protein VN325_17950 [Steroidobacteraceae bacterium]|nr:hypothetical protein [Steroidobacteraceae bacterium]